MAEDRTVTSPGFPGLPDRLGPCRLERPLGSGGMGMVFLAELIEDRDYGRRGDRVALKVLRPGLAQPGEAFQRFEREARLGTSLDHPCLVRSYELGSARSGPDTWHYLVMEYVEGRTLADLVKEMGVLPEALVRHMAVQVCEGLEAIHRSGAVHRDVKPSNILVTPDHQVKLMDLGLTRRVDDAMRVTEAGAFVGTLHFASPEQFAGQEVGPPGDLYSLGVALYEATTGTLPFEARDIAGIMRLHREVPPPPPRSRNPDITPFFQEVLLHLLEKEPEDRFPSAAELARILEEGEHSSWWRDRLHELESGGRRKVLLPHVSRDVPMAGRDAEMEEARRLFEEARSGRGRTLLVEGEAGVGKTRFVAEFLEGLTAEVSDVGVLYGACPPGGTGGEADALGRAVVDAFGEARLDRRLSQSLGGLAHLAPAFGAFLKGEPPPEGVEPLVPSVLHVLFEHLLRDLAGRGPLVWVVEDLHFGTPEGRALLVPLARAAAGLPVLLLLTTRNPPSAAELEPFERAGVLRRLSLGRLAANDLRTVLGKAVGSATLAGRLWSQVGERSGGNPLLLMEILRGLREEGLLEQVEDGRWTARHGVSRIEVPSTVREIFLSRLDQLEAEDRAILDVASVLGFRFDPDLVARAREKSRLEVLERLAGLERRSRAVRSEGAAYRFDHNLLQEVIYGQMPDSLRFEIHRRLADVYAEREHLEDKAPGEVPGEAAFFLARHFLSGGEGKRGVRYLDRALDHLASAYRSEALLDLARSALAQLGQEDPGRRAGILLRAASTLDMLGRTEEERLAVEGAVRAAEEAGDEVLMGEALCSLGWWHLWRYEYEEAGRASRGALDHAVWAEAPALHARAASQLGLVAYHLGDYEEARMRHEEDLEISRDSEDDRGQGRACINLGLMDLRLGAYESAATRLEEAIARFQRARYREGEILALSNAGTVHRLLGRHGEAHRERDQALRLAREIGYRHGEGHVLSGLSSVLALDEGRLDDAEEDLSLGLELADALEESRFQARCRLGRGLLAWRRGREEEAEEELGLAREMFGRLHQPQGRAEASLALGRLRMQRGDEAGARPLLQEASDLSRKLRLSDPGCLPALYLGLLDGAVDLDAEVPASQPALLRAEAHAVLLAAGVGEEHRREGRAILEEVAASLPEGSRDLFWERLSPTLAPIGRGD